MIETKNETDLQRKIELRIADIERVADMVPGVIIIHDLETSSVIYMSPKGEKLLGVTLPEIINMGAQYHTHFFNPEDSNDYVPKIIGLLTRNNNDESVTYFQQVRVMASKDWVWYMSNTKIFMRDDEGKPISTITLSFPVDPLHHITSKVSRLLEENIFLRKNYHQFSQLGKRECEVLKHMALGKTSAEIGDILFISLATVETHRRNIRQKLGVSSSYDLAQYARAFDLI